MKPRNSSIAEYVIVGAGPAAICAVAKLVGTGLNASQIIWVDPEFACGDFGTVLSVGSSVPGNTKVADYNKVNQAIYNLLPKTAPTLAEKQAFAITHLATDYTCSLREATEPMQHLTHKLSAMVTSLRGKVTEITEVQEGLRIRTELANETVYLLSRRVILATGAKPRELNIYSGKRIHPNDVFIKSQLQAYLTANPQVKKVAVFGSSHSAALAVMHLLQAGIPVIQFINKPYLFAQAATTADGAAFTLHDNTGLKGEVARFTKSLLTGEFAFADKWQQVDSAKMDDYLEQCTHFVEAIGYVAQDTLTINGQPLRSYTYNKHTSEIAGVKGLFGIGIAFPQEKTSLSGEVELSVGYGKFWTTVNDEKIFSLWQKNAAGHVMNALTSPFFAAAEAKETAIVDNVCGPSLDK